MKQTMERELKFAAPADFVLPEFPGDAIPPRSFTSTYYDTPDFKLSSLQLTLRRRVENRKGLWQLKLPRGDARVEIERPGPRTIPPPDLTALLPAVLRGAPLAPVCKMRTKRSGFVVRDGADNAAEMVLDRVEVLEGDKLKSSFTEVEVELIKGNQTHLRNLESVLRRQGAGDAYLVPKLFKVLDIQPDKDQLKAGSDSDLARVQRALKAQFQRMLQYDPGTRLGAYEEDLHQHRVAIRRLRAILGSASPLLDPDWSGSLRDELEWAGDLLNPVREMDVLLAHFRREVELLGPEESPRLKPFLSRLASTRKRAREQMLKGLNDERYLRLIGALDESTTTLSVRPSGKGLSEASRNAFRNLRSTVDSLESDPTDDRLHRIRILAKKARYVAELIPGGKTVGNYIECVKRLQDVLGEHQDAAQAEETVKLFAAGLDDPVITFSAGRLAEREAERKRAARADFSTIWPQMQKSGKKAWK